MLLGSFKSSLEFGQSLWSPWLCYMALLSLLLLRLAVRAPMEELRKRNPAAGIQRIPVDLVNPLRPTPDPQNCILPPHVGDVSWPRAGTTYWTPRRLYWGRYAGQPWISEKSTLALGFPGGSVVKNSPANAGDTGLIFGSGRFLGEGNYNSLQYSCLENSMGKRSLAGCRPWGHEERTRLRN